jgi:hypothetical protein
MARMLGGTGNRDHDGASADPVKLKPTKAQGIPINLTASTRCEQCGTGEIFAGKPGSRITKFTCRTCGFTPETINNGTGFTYQSPN